jgi:hypothetical protein
MAEHILTLGGDLGEGSMLVEQVEEWVVAKPPASAWLFFNHPW